MCRSLVARAYFHSTGRKLSSNHRILHFKTHDFATLKWRHGIRSTHFRHIAFMHGRKPNRESLIRHRNDSAMLAVDGRNRSSPESLATHQPVSKSIVRRRCAPAFLLCLREQSLCRFRDREFRERTAIAERGGGRVRENGKNREMEAISKRSVA